MVNYTVSSLLTAFRVTLLVYVVSYIGYNLFIILTLILLNDYKLMSFFKQRITFIHVPFTYLFE